MHATLERAFNQVTEGAAVADVDLPQAELLAQLLETAGPMLDAAPGMQGWDVWQGISHSAGCQNSRWRVGTFDILKYPEGVMVCSVRAAPTIH